MFVSKKKYERDLWKAKVGFSDYHRESQQSEKIWELEVAVKKLQKQVLKLKEQVKNGY
jgi:hypothetical protein